MITLENIYLKRGDKILFEDLSLRVGKGEKLLIRGPSGCGKSSLLQMIMGFVQPDSGRVRIDGEILTRHNVWTLRKRMAFVGQELNLGPGKVSDFFQEIFAYKANRHLQYNESEVLGLFDRFLLEKGKLNQAISALSGGEKQRVALIAALLLDREIYLLDEITSAIDEALRETVMAYLASIPGKTMIVVSHERGWEAFGMRVLAL